MANTSVAQARAYTRELRGLKLYREHGDEIATNFKRGTYRVPGCDGATYTVRLSPEEYCSCPDFEQNKTICKHVYAVRIVKAKTSPCEGCGRRFRSRDLYEVDENNLTFFEGDLLCRSCAIAHGVI